MIFEKVGPIYFPMHKPQGPTYYQEQLFRWWQESDIEKSKDLSRKNVS